MFSLISDSMRSATLRLCFGLVFAVLTVASYKAHSEEGSFSTDLDIFSILPAHSSAVPPAYRINLNLALTRAEDTASFGSGFGNTPRLDRAAEPTADTIWPTNTRLKNVPDNALNSALNSLSAFLRYESKDDRVVIKPKRNSLFVEWRKSF